MRGEGKPQRPNEEEKRYSWESDNRGGKKGEGAMKKNKEKKKKKRISSVSYKRKR